MRTFVTCLLVFVGGCYGPGSTADSGGAPDPEPASNPGAPAAPDPFPRPAGCEQNVCDIDEATCTNPKQHDPCADCYEACDSYYDPNFDCYGACDECSRNSPGPRDYCGEAVSDCRTSPRNAVCADDLAKPGPAGQPCGDVASEVLCACTISWDGHCWDALYALAPACSQCMVDYDWRQACIAAACPKESATNDACREQASCADGDACPACDATDRALSDCVDRALNDPADTAGCRADAHRCFTKPFCTLDGHAQP